MASITSMMSGGTSSLSSIYGSRNVISGLASGMDTETMIENAVSGIKLKIQNLQKRRTKIEWQQEAYRSIIDKAVNFNTKYTSYSSKTNLLSASFFDKAVNTTVKGTWKDKITATGKTSSDIKINAVKQLATAATYTVSGLGGKYNGEISGIDGQEFDLGKDLDVSTVSGSLSLKYGGTNGATFTINFDELENLNEVEVLDADGNVKEDATDVEKLAQAINNKLGEITYSYTKNGFQETTTADKAIKVEVDPLTLSISFKDGLGTGNKVSIAGVSGKFDDIPGADKGSSSIRFAGIDGLTEKVSTSEYLGGTKGDDGKWSGGKELGITFNGTTKKINMSDIMNKIDFSYDADKDKNTQFKEALQKELDDAFGKDKVTVDHTDGKLSFKTDSGSTLSLGGSAVEALGFESGDSNFVNPGKKLSDLLDDSIFKDENKLMGVGEARLSSNGKYYVDEKGNRVNKDGVRLNSDGEEMYKFTVNGADINVTKGTTLESLMNSINSSAEAGVKVNYSKLTNEFKFTATETGANGKIEFEGLAQDLFGPPSDVEVNHNFGDNFGISWLKEGQDANMTVQLDGFAVNVSVNKSTTMEDFARQIQENSGSALKASYDAKTGQFTVTDQSGAKQDFTIKDQWDDSYKREIKPVVNYTSGQDAIMDVEINGKRFENLTRSSNSFDIDGLTVNVKGEFTTGVDKDGKPEEPITFETSTDTDKIVETIREFVNDYNEMVTEIKNAYSTMPAQKSNGARYEPLTAEQEDQYSESELKAYNEKAKQGILFGDSDLSSMYSKLLSSIQPGGSDGQTLREIGIGTAYSNGMTTLSLDEDKLRAALESDPDKVKSAFTKSKEGGSSSDGLMQTMQNTLNNYVKTTGEPKGILIQRAGSNKAFTSLNNNSLKTQMDNLDSQIDRWTDKMARQIDRYTTQFSRLEQLIAEMNSQASSMAGLMGGSGGY